MDGLCLAGDADIDSARKQRIAQLDAQWSGTRRSASYEPSLHQEGGGRPLLPEGGDEWVAQEEVEAMALGEQGVYQGQVGLMPEQRAKPEVRPFPGPPERLVIAAGSLLSANEACSRKLAHRPLQPNG